MMCFELILKRDDSHKVAESKAMASIDPKIAAS